MRMTDERGQTALEYLGILLLVAVLVAAIGQLGLGGKIGGAIEAKICEIARLGCPTSRPSRAAGALRRSIAGGNPRAPRALATSRSPAASRRTVSSARAFAARRGARASGQRLSGVIKGRKIDTSRYRHNDYCRLYRCKKPAKTEYPMPDFQGRRGGTLRFSLFIKKKKVGLGPIQLQGDGRGFDKRFDSLRTRATFVFDFKTRKLTILINPSCSYGASAIKNGCSSPKENKITVAAGSNGKGDRDPYSIDYSLKNSRTGLPGLGNKAPAIDGRIALIPIRDSKGHNRIKVVVYNDGYPSIEGYYDPPGPNGPRKLCQKSEGDPTDLAGSAPKQCEGDA